MAGSNYVAFNIAQTKSSAEQAQARNNIGAAGISSLAASFESRAPSYVWSAGEVCTYGGALWQFDSDHSGAWTGADAHDVSVTGLGIDIEGVHPVQVEDNGAIPGRSFAVNIAPNGIGRDLLKNHHNLVPDTNYLQFKDFGGNVVVTLCDSLKTWLEAEGYTP